MIVFREQKAETTGCARYLARELGLPPAQVALAALPDGDQSAASAALRAVLGGGVAFHNADLDRAERATVEEHLRASGSAIRVIVATTTLAMGVNTPAEAVIVAGLRHPGTPPTPYTVAEYKNIVGRAGRLGYAARGTSYLLAASPLQEHDGWERYVRGAPESLRSRFLLGDTDPRSLIVKVLVAAGRVTGGTMDGPAIVGFLEGSFGAFQRRAVDRGLDLGPRPPPGRAGGPGGGTRWWHAPAPPIDSPLSADWPARAASRSRRWSARWRRSRPSRRRRSPTPPW